MVELVSGRILILGGRGGLMIRSRVLMIQGFWFVGLWHVAVIEGSTSLQALNVKP